MWIRPCDVSRGVYRFLLMCLFLLAGCEKAIYGEGAYLEELSYEEVGGIFGREDDGGGYAIEAEAEEDYVVGEESPQPPHRPTPPPHRTHIRVEKGDTLYALARRHGMNVEDLAALNDLSPPYVIRAGQSLRVTKTPTQPPVHKVLKGETAYAIAKRYGVTIADLIAANDLPDASQLAVGQSLHIGKEKAHGRTRGDGVSDSASQRQSAPKRHAVPPNLPKNRHFLWPVQGRVLGDYGHSKDGYHNDGINVQAQAGTPVRATEDGVVVYRGDDVKGFGNLVLVSHGLGWTSAYAHLDAIRVKRGQAVKRGSVLGMVGMSGHVREAQLHFELRHHRKPVKPQLYLEKP